MEHKRFSEAQVKKLKMYWASAMESTDRYREMLDSIETVMQTDLDIPTLEFFWSEIDGLAGIGTQWADESEKFGLLQAEDLEDEEM